MFHKEQKDERRITKLLSSVTSINTFTPIHVTIMNTICQHWLKSPFIMYSVQKLHVADNSVAFVVWDLVRAGIIIETNTLFRIKS
jgi:hypothetical protein